MITSDYIKFSKEWFDEIAKGDDFNEATPQDLAYILYAAAIFSFTGEKTNIGEVFGKEYSYLNRTMSGYYGQIERMIMKGQEQSIKNQKYDSKEIEKLAAIGKSQKEICLELGYDPTKSKSLSSNPGYKSGRKIFLAEKEKEIISPAVDNNSKNFQETVKNWQF